MYKLVCLDLDGTINDGWELLPQVKQKLFEIKSEGVRVAIVTGRESIGTLFFVHRSGFPFDYIGCGGGPIISTPLVRTNVLDLFEPLTVEIVTKHGPSKTGRLLKIMELCGCSGSETIFIDDNNAQLQDVIDVRDTTSCFLGCPLSKNEQWKEVVSNRGGIISDKPCGLGTLEILNKLF